MPGRVRSTRTAVGAVVGASTVAGIGSWLLRQRRSSQEAKARSTEVVVRIVTEPRPPRKTERSNIDRSRESDVDGWIHWRGR